MPMWLVTVTVLVLSGMAPATPLSSPPTVTVTPPAADLPPEVAALSGVWEGMWDGELPCRLAVEELTRDVAVVLYAWGDFPAAHGWGGWVRRRASVLPGGTLQWGGRLSTTKEPVTFTFTLSEDYTHLRGERRLHETWGVSIATLQPMAPTQDPSHSLLLGQEADRELAEATSRLHEALPRYAELTAPVPIDIPAVQSLLHRDEALVSWFTLDDCVLV